LNQEAKINFKHGASPTRAKYLLEQWARALPCSITTTTGDVLLITARGCLTRAEEMPDKSNPKFTKHTGKRRTAFITTEKKRASKDRLLVGVAVGDYDQVSPICL